MALAFRFDKITVNANGTIDVMYTAGTKPLPAGASGRGITLQSRLEAVSIKDAQIANFTDWEMFKMALAVYAIASADPNLTGATALVGKVLTVDPTLPNSVMSYA